MNQPPYKRLKLTEREEISRALAQGHGIRWISRKLNRSPSTINREIRKGGCNRYLYRAMRAHKRAYRHVSRRKKGKHKLSGNPALFKFVIKKLALFWSPEQIVNAIKKAYPCDPSMRISEEAIYSYLYVLPKGELKKRLLSMLRQGHGRRHRRRTKPSWPRKIPGMVSIEERPSHVENRDVPGHWEGDLLMGKNRQSSLGTLVERKTRLTLLVPLKNRTAETVRLAFEKEMSRFPSSLRKSLTYDQGREMADHHHFTKRTKIKVYFAHPASPWERGSNENTNGLIRQFFPKGTNFNLVHRNAIKRVERLLNERPRKTLKFQTPYEVYQQVLR